MFKKGLFKLVLQGFKSQFFKDTSILVWGTLIAQLIPILIQPLIRRYYTPEVFGVFAVYSGIVTLLPTIFTLRYEYSIVLPKQNFHGFLLTIGSLIISCSLSILLFFIILLKADFFIKLLKLNDKFEFVIYLIPFSILLYSANQVFNYWFIRKKQYLTNSGLKVLRRTTESIVIIPFSLLKKGIGLFIGDIIGQISSLITALYYFRKNKINIGFKLQFNKILILLKKYWRFPVYNSLPAFLESTTIIFPVIAVNHIYGQQIAGQMDLARLVLLIPIVFISQAVQQILFKSIVELKKNSISMYKSIFWIFITLFLISSLFICIILLLTDTLFPIFFGKGWEIAASILKILCFAFAARIIVMPLTIILVAFEKLFVLAIWQVLYSIQIFLLFYFQGTYKDFFYRLAVIDIIAYSICLCIIIFFISKYEQSIEFRYIRK